MYISGKEVSDKEVRNGDVHVAGKPSLEQLEL